MKFPEKGMKESKVSALLTKYEDNNIPMERVWSTSLAAL